MTPPVIESPCIGVCVLDTHSFCTGCGRSIAEIAEWSQAGNARRLTVIENARRRRETGSALRADPRPS